MRPSKCDWHTKATGALPRCSRDDWHLPWHESTKHRVKTAEHTYTHTDSHTLSRSENTVAFRLSLQQSSGSVGRKCVSGTSVMQVIWRKSLGFGGDGVSVSAWRKLCWCSAAAPSGLSIGQEGQQWNNKQCEVIVSLWVNWEVEDRPHLQSCSGRSLKQNTGARFKAFLDQLSSTCCVFLKLTVI